MSRVIVFLALLPLVATACNGGAVVDSQITTVTSDSPSQTTGTSSAPTTLVTSTTATSTCRTTSTTTPVTSLTTSTSTTMAPPRSEESDVIAYNHGGELWLISADGTDARALVTSVAVQGGPTWSPDGAMLAFSGFELGPSVVIPDIWVVSMASGTVTNITHSSGPGMLAPSWSPSGAQIVFATTERDLWIIDRDGERRHRIASDIAHLSSPAWAPDGTLIAYCSLPVTDGRIGSDDVWVVEPDGDNPVRLTDRGDACLPAWSPDSSQIAFTAWVFPQDAPGDHSNVWVMSRDGSEQRNLTDDPSRFDRAPDWSPDGTRIAFDSAGPLQGREDPDIGLVIEHDPPADVYVMPAGGGPKTSLTTSHDPDGAPAWRPLG
jgi:Tol biopolymer transport system component